jgi:hypothetical protein
MKLEIITSSRGIESANMILARGIEGIEENAAIQKAFGINNTDIKHAKAFRKALLKAFTNGRAILDEDELENK